MNLRPRLLHIILAALAVLLLSISAACGGGDDESTQPTATEAQDNSLGGDGDGGDGDNSEDGGPASEDLAAYFAEIDAIFEDADAQSDELEALFDEAYSNAVTVEDAKQALGSFLLDTSAIYSDALDALEAIEAPAEAADAHDAFIQAGADLLDLTARLFEALQDVETEEDLNQLSEDFDAEGTAAAAAADDACYDLQTIANDAGIDVDLNCED